MTVYSASKAFLDFLSRGIAYEHQNVDILSLKPGHVSTKMINYRKPGFDTIKVEEFVLLGLGKLGHVTHSVGHWKHKLQLILFLAYPEFLKTDMLRERFLKKS